MVLNDPDQPGRALTHPEWYLLPTDSPCPAMVLLWVRLMDPGPDWTRLAQIEPWLGPNPDWTLSLADLAGPWPIQSRFSLISVTLVLTDPGSKPG